MKPWWPVLLLLAACQPAALPPAASPLQLRPCELPAGAQGRVAARCGELEVPEDRFPLASTPGGRTLRLRVAVVPADGPRVAEDPLFLLAGGPGQSAVTVYPYALGIFAKVQRRRDLVLVDQRGTGGSGALECPQLLLAMRDSNVDAMVNAAAACQRAQAADLRHYHTAAAMEDLDAVREALGYERINLYGGSYGTRAALSYLRQHPERVRAVILDGVAPPDWNIIGGMAKGAQRALALVLQRCAEDPGCQRAFPSLPERFEALMARSRAGRVELTVPHPLTSQPTTMTLEGRFVGDAVRSLSYAVETVALLPLLIDDAARSGQLARLAAAVLATQDSPMGRLSLGMHLAVLCTEDMPVSDDGDVGSYVGGLYTDLYRRLCAQWPRGTPPPGYREPVRSDRPVLLLSGELDPVTPPELGEQALRTLSRGRHLVVRGATHNVLVRGCTPRLIADFLEKADAAALDTSCLLQFRPLRFFTSFNGPNP